MEESKSILKRIDRLEGEVKNLKKKTVEVDKVMTQDDEDSLKQASRDFAEGKTVRL